MSNVRGVKEIDEETIERARKQAATADRVIVKAGTNSLTDEDSQLDRVKLDKLVGDVMALQSHGTDVLLVSSAAIGAGRGLVDRSADTLEERQALSTVGQSHLMRHYTQSFERYDQKVAQVLLTEEDLANPERFTNFQNTVERLFDWGLIPIINENDAVATQEIQIGDNDLLSASVAIGLDVDLLITLTDVEGVFTDNPKDDPDVELIEAVGTNYDAVESVIDDSTSASFGGIQTKVEGARDVSEHGIPAIIAGSKTTNVLERIATSKPVGTIFVPQDGDTDD
jgi:glutamate 5-kinase